MQTVRQIERLWKGQAYSRLFRELAAHRPETEIGTDARPTSVTTAVTTMATAVAAAAMAMIRLDELNQPQAPIYSAMLRTLLATQEADGGWGDVATTALCLRALMTGRHSGGRAIDLGLKYLTDLQKPEGIWPAVPFRRMPADPRLSAFVLYQLGNNAAFRQAIRFPDAISWFYRNQNQAAMDDGAKRLWDRAEPRCRMQQFRQPTLVWS